MSTADPTATAATEKAAYSPVDLVPLTLVPVEVFGTDSYGLSDAVEAWSDCNRAVGRIYRVEDLDGPRRAGDTVTVYVRREDVPWFERRFGDDDQAATSTTGQER